MEAINLRHDASGGQVQVCTHGGHIISWVPSSPQHRSSSNQPRRHLSNEHFISSGYSKTGSALFLSREAIFAPDKPIRGGIPICFPQFSNFGPLPQHGFARVSEFSVIRRFEQGDQVLLGYRPSAEQLRAYPHPFYFEYLVRVGDRSLFTEVRVTNEDPALQPLEFTFALHTYFKLVDGADISVARVNNLQGCTYMDNLRGRDKFVDDEAGEDGIVFDREVDRIYLNTPQEIGIRIGPNADDEVLVAKSETLPDAVVWNPWIEKSKAMADFGNDEYKEMLCVEAGAIGTPVRVEPGETWVASQILTYKRPLAKSP